MSFESVISEDGDAAAAILAEAEEWQGIMALDAEKVLDVYLDMKSPHAYLAVRPTLEVARDYRVRLNFLPYTMSYTAIGVSKSVEPDMKRRPPSPAADRKARMYYTAARQYAALQGLPFRSPYRLLDSASAHKAFLFAKQQGLEVPFLMIAVRGAERHLPRRFTATFAVGRLLCYDHRQPRGAIGGISDQSSSTERRSIQSGIFLA